MNSQVPVGSRTPGSATLGRVTALRPASRRSAADRFASICAVVARNLPFGLSRWVAPSFLGFAAISGFTFGVDLILLTVMYGVLGWPNALAVTLGYAVAFGLSFLLNRWLNFHSHAPVGPQAGKYAVAVGINYVAFILGVGAGLTALGVQYQLARILAGACEGVFMYCVMRWVVFPTRKEPDATA